MDVLRGAAWTLFGRDGFNDEAAGLFWVERNFRSVKPGVHKGNNFRIVQGGSAFEPYMAGYIAAAQQSTVRIGNASALQKAKADVIGIEGDREYGIGGTLVGNETDHKGIVIVVDHFEGANEALAQFGQGAAGK